MYNNSMWRMPLCTPDFCVMSKNINILVIVILVVFNLTSHAFADLLKNEFLTKAKQNNWKIFVGTGYSKTAFFLDLDGRYEPVFPNKNHIIELFFSPSGKRVAFLEDMESDGNFYYYLTIANIDMSYKKSIQIQGDMLRHIVWSPSNENEIAFLSDYKYDNESYTLYLFNIKHTSKKIIAKDLVSALGFPAFSWSPDGEKIVFTSTKGKIMSVNKDGSKLQLVCDDEGTVPAWSPDGAFIAYRQGRNYVEKFNDGSSKYSWTGSGKYYVVNIYTKERMEIFSNKIFDVFPLHVYTQPVWSPNGRYILLYKVYDLGFKTDFWVVNLDKRKVIYHFKSDVKPSTISWIESN